MHWPSGFPRGAQQLIRLLKDVLVIPCGDNLLDLAIALDWYKIAEDGVDPMDWRNTTAGQLVAEAKYYMNPGTTLAAQTELAELISDAIHRHPNLQASPYLISVPGSMGDGQSAAEQIARIVAEKTGKILVPALGPQREPRKGAGMSTSLEGLISVPTSLEGSCVVFDDVYRSGTTMRATSAAARAAGATEVFGVVATKTVSG
ncbi:hypothetical protein B1R94_08650 [Mycolicibacterium litorale]|nr:hypothetical protein B1R94_08650 [Mycolicibacterium litorale]